MAKNLVQFKELLEVTENTIIKIFNSRIEKLEEKLLEYREENKELKNEVKDLKAALEFQNDRHEKVVKELAEEKEKFNDNNKELEVVGELKKENENLKNNMAELEDRHRRNNLRFEGFKDDGNETWSQSEEKITSFIKDKLGIEKTLAIERAHRVPSKNNNPSKKRTIVAKFLNYKDRETILRRYRELKLWENGIYINEDFSDSTMMVRKELFRKAKELRNEGKYAKVNYKTLVSY